MAKYPLAVLLLVLATAPVFASATSEDEKAAQANELISLAWSVYNTKLELDASWCEENGVPYALRTQEQRAIYLLLQAARIAAEESAAYYNLGMFFIDKDCARSTYYFRKHLELVPGEEDTMKVLAEIERCGCLCGYHLLGTGEATPSEHLLLLQDLEKAKADKVGEAPSK